MRRIRRALARIATLLRGHARADAELRAEMEAHLELETAEYVRRGMPPDEARRRALIASGGLLQAAESVREQRGIPSIESLGADARYALRHFRRTPLATAAMLVVLSLGIGTTVVLFTVLDSLVTLPAPGLARDEALVRIRGISRTRGAAEPQARLLSWPEVREYGARAELFTAVAADASESAVVGTGDASLAPIAATVIYATPNYFRVLGVRPALGGEPAAGPDPTRLAASPTAVISDAMWTRHFGGARDVIGRVVRVNDVPVEIVGVAPPRFLGTEDGTTMTLWVPLAAYPLLQRRSGGIFLSADSAFLNAAARLRPGVTTALATPVIAGIAGRVFRPVRTVRAEDAGRPDAAPAGAESGSADVVPMLAGNARVSNRKDLLLSAAAAGGFAVLVLLITCTNVSALMVGMAVARRREIGVRLALGARRARLVRQLLTESVMLALVAAAVGLVVTAAGVRLAGAALEDIQLVVDWRVALASCAVAVAAGMLFGLSPALHATRVPVGEVLKASATAVAASRSWLQRALVVAQIALTQPLLVGLAVVVATMVTDLGRRQSSGAADRIVEVELDSWAGRVSDAERAARIDAVVQRVAALPGVAAAMPMPMGTVDAPLAVLPADRIAGVSYPPAMQARLMAAPRDWFRAFGIPIVRGRDFDERERAHSPAAAYAAPSFDAVIIGSDLARRFWGTADPIGRRFVLATSEAASARPMVVVGVVDEKAAGAGEVNGYIRIYVPYSAMNTGVIARTSAPALPMLDAMRTAVVAEAPQMPILRLETMAQREAGARRDLVHAGSAIAGGGLLALLLSAIGLYAVVSFAVGQRTREIGIRTALGARGDQVVRLFFAQGLVLSAIGLALGLPLSVVAARVIALRLGWPLETSPLLGVATGLVVLLVALVAVWIPARRASAIDPIVALRAE